MTQSFADQQKQQGKSDNEVRPPSQEEERPIQPPSQEESKDPLGDLFREIEERDPAEEFSQEAEQRTRNRRERRGE